MSDIATKIRLACRRMISAADAESAYAEIIKIVGGTYYNSGVAVGPANGTLDWRNFKRDAGIKNVNKANPNGRFAISIYTTGNTSIGGGATFDLYAPVVLRRRGALPMAATVIGWSSVCARSAAGTSSITALTMSVPSGSSSIPAPVAIPIAPGYTILADISGLNLEIKDNDVIHLAGTTAAGPVDTMYDMVTLVWCKTRHLG